MSSEIAQLVATLKRELKARGLTYRDVAQALDLSEASVKRLFASERFTLQRLGQVTTLLGLSVGELCQQAAASLPELTTLTVEQEQQLVADPTLLLIAVCVLNRWTAPEIGATYSLSMPEVRKGLFALDRMGLIELLPGDRVRRRVRRDFDWRPDGPIRAFFRNDGLPDFLRARFDGPLESLEFAHGMLTRDAQRELALELRRLRRTLSRLHEECEAQPLAAKHGVGVLLGLREWEPAAFERRRHAPTAQNGRPASSAKTGTARR